MALFKQRPDTPVSEQARWSAGQSHLTTAIRWAMIAGIAGGIVSPVLLVGGVLHPPPPAASPRHTAAVDTVEQSVAGDLAVRLVLTWLQAARGEERSLQPYVATDRVRLPLAQAFLATDASIARIESATAAPPPATASTTTSRAPATSAPLAHTWTVTVAATVRGVADPPAAAVRRYFAVPVLVTGGVARASALPAPTAAPMAGADIDLGYRHPLTNNHPIWTTITQFLTALTAGGGDVSRYTAPGTRIRAITPAPYTTVTMLEARADQDFTTAAGRAVPADGATARVLATAEMAATPATNTLTGQWALTLAARGGRWEITAVDTAPLLAADNRPPQPSLATPPGTTAPASSTTPRTPASSTPAKSTPPAAPPASTPPAGR